MKSALKPALESLNDALERLEDVMEKRLENLKAAQAAAPAGINRKIAAKLDETIHRLETLLAEEK